MEKILLWDIYEVTAKTALNGVMLRGRIRKLGIENGFNVLAENTEDMENGVRFAVLEKESATKVIDYLNEVITDASVSLVLESVQNPNLSKLKVNSTDRYTL
jgi:hypothetical protein